MLFCINDSGKKSMSQFATYSKQVRKLNKSLFMQKEH